MNASLQEAETVVWRTVYAMEKGIKAMRFWFGIEAR
jgi:hypothetical protein